MGWCPGRSGGAQGAHEALSVRSYPLRCRARDGRQRLVERSPTASQPVVNPPTGSESPYSSGEALHLQVTTDGLHRPSTTSSVQGQCVGRQPHRSCKHNFHADLVPSGWMREMRAIVLCLLSQDVASLSSILGALSERSPYSLELALIVVRHVFGVYDPV